MTNNGAAVVHLSVGLLALGGEGLLALLNVGGVHNGLTHGPGHLALVLLGNLVALSVHLLLALGAARVASITRLSLGLPLAITVTMGDDLGVMANNSGALVNLLGDGVAMLGDDVLALLDVGGVHNHVVLLVTLLPLVLDGLLVALLVRVAEALEVVVFTVTRFSLSLPLSITMTMGDDLGVMTNNSGAVADLLGDGIAVLGHDVLALLDIGGVHDGVILLVTNLSGNLALVLLGDLVALSVNLLLALGTARVSSISRLGLSISLGLSLSDSSQAGSHDSEDDDRGSEHLHDDS